MEDFYATFPSNVGMDVFSYNTASYVTVHLRDPLDLRGDQWELAFVEASVPTLWQNIDDDN